MKIIYIVHQFYPKWYTGTEKLVYLLASMMQKRGHTVKVLTYASKAEQVKSVNRNSIFTYNYFYKGIQVISFTYDKSPADLNYGLHNAKLAEYAKLLIAEEKPDIFHIAHPMRTGEIIFQAQEMNIPYILTLTDFWLICPKYILMSSDEILCNGPNKGHHCKNHCEDIPISLIEDRLTSARTILKHASCVCAPTKFLMEIIENEIPGIHSKIVELGLVKAKTDEEPRHYKSGDSLKFMFGGSFVPHKGLHILLEAIKNINSDSFTLDLYGSGPEGPYSKKIKKYIDDDKRIIYKKVFEESQFDEIFKNIDLLIIPSTWWENSPYMMKEAMARNIPIIASDVGGLTENVKHMKNGFTFRVGDIYDLKKIIEMILDKPYTLNEIRKNLQKEIIATVEQEAYLYEKIYKSCVR